MIHFIVNIRGGSGHAFTTWSKVQKILKERKIEHKIHVTQRAGHASQIARELALSGGEDLRLVVVGGDGALNEVINGIGKNENHGSDISSFSKVKIGLIPTGSGNDFSRGMKIPRHSPKKALDLILNAGDGRSIDLGKATVLDDEDGEICGHRKSRESFFAISSGFALDAIVGTGINTAKIKKILNFLHLGKLSYGIYTVQTLFTMKTYSVKMKFDNEEAKLYKKIIFIANMNFSAEGGGIPMSPEARGNDGELSLCMAFGVPKILTFFLFPFLLAGLQKHLPGFLMRNFKTLEIESDNPSVLHTDGEFRGNVRRVKWEVIPGAMTFLA